MVVFALVGSLVDPGVQGIDLCYGEADAEHNWEPYIGCLPFCEKGNVGQEINKAWNRCLRCTLRRKGYGSKGNEVADYYGWVLC